MNFCHRRPVSAVFTEHWWVGSEWRGSSCSFDTAGSRPTSSHCSHTLKWPQNLDSSSGSCLFVPWLCLRVSDGQEISVCAGQWNSAVQGVSSSQRTSAKLIEPAAHLRGWRTKGELPFYTNTLSIVEVWVLYTVRHLLIAILVVCCHF